MQADWEKKIVWHCLSGYLATLWVICISYIVSPQDNYLEEAEAVIFLWKCFYGIVLFLSKHLNLGNLGNAKPIYSKSAPRDT